MGHVRIAGKTCPRCGAGVLVPDPILWNERALYHVVCKAGCGWDTDKVYLLRSISGQHPAEFLDDDTKNIPDDPYCPSCGDEKPCYRCRV